MRRPDGTLAVGRSLPGRGAWFCKGSPACLERAVHRGVLERALRSAIAAGAAEALGREPGLAADVRGWMDTPGVPRDA